MITQNFGNVNFQLGIMPMYADKVIYCGDALINKDENKFICYKSSDKEAYSNIEAIKRSPVALIEDRFRLAYYRNDKSLWHILIDINSEPITINEKLKLSFGIEVVNPINYRICKRGYYYYIVINDWVLFTPYEALPPYSLDMFRQILEKAKLQQPIITNGIPEKISLLKDVQFTSAFHYLTMNLIAIGQWMRTNFEQARLYSHTIWLNNTFPHYKKETE